MGRLGNDSQGYKSGAVRSIGNGTVRRVINAAAPDNGLMVVPEHRRTLHDQLSARDPWGLGRRHRRPGHQIGAAANWPNPASNHVHISLVTGALHVGRLVVRLSELRQPAPAAAADTSIASRGSPPTLRVGSGISEGQFVSYGGHVYRIAGGAPIYVSSWDRFGGPKPTTALSAAQFGALPTYPRDGTLISGQAPGHADHGTVYRIAGGAPLYVSSFAHIGGDTGTIGVDLSAIHNAGGGSPWNHLRYRPAEGTFISGQAPGHPEHGSVYTIAGGAPIYVSSFANVGGNPGTVPVDLAAIHNAGSAGRWSHLNWFPTDGAFVSISDGSVLRFAGGAPIPVSNWANIGGHPAGAAVTRVDHVALSSAGAGGRWNHVRYHPADGTILDASGTKYQVRDGAPYAHSTSVAGIRVDPVAIQRAGQPGLWSHLKAPIVATTPTPTPDADAHPDTDTDTDAGPDGDAGRPPARRACGEAEVGAAGDREPVLSHG